MAQRLGPTGLAIAVWVAASHAAGAADEGFLELVADGLDFPSSFTTSEDNSDRLFIVDYYVGKILVLENGEFLPEPFLDIQDVLEREREATSGETGLISLAFPPRPAERAQAYVTYTGQGNRLVLSRFDLNQDGSQAIRSSEKTILSVENWSGEHHCGHMAFGPDGLLYLCIGDSGRPMAAQDLGLLNGSILRIDVQDGREPYAVPTDNPFVDVEGARPEIWIYGVRNPWRFSFGSSADVYVPEPGSRFWEELNMLPSGSAGGANLGWALAEGNQCRAECSVDELVWPVYSYAYGEHGCSIIGGTEYRGQQYQEWAGVYVFADFCTGDIWGIRDFHGDPKIRMLVNGHGTGDPRGGASDIDDFSGPTAIGVGPDDEILVANGPGGSIHQLHFPADFDTAWQETSGLQLTDVISVERSGYSWPNVQLRAIKNSHRWRWTQPLGDLYRLISGWFG